MTIKLILLTTGENLIADVKEGLYEERVVCYILENPCEVKVTGSYAINGESQSSISLNRWPMLSKDTTIQIPPESVTTLTDPVDKLTSLFTTQVLGENNGECETAGSIERTDSGESD
jgi:hypothetical protein